jgi:hypothetical protein
MTSTAARANRNLRRKQVRDTRKQLMARYAELVKELQGVEKELLGGLWRPSDTVYAVCAKTDGGGSHDLLLFAAKSAAIRYADDMKFGRGRSVGKHLSYPFDSRTIDVAERLVLGDVLEARL